MNARALAAPNRALFALLAFSMVAMTVILPKLGFGSSNRSATEIGVLLAFTVELPFYFWFLVLRRKGSGLLYAVPVAVLGYLFCRSWASGADPGWIAWAWIPLAPLEVWFLTVLTKRAMHVLRVGQTLPRSSDLIERLLLAAEREFPGNRWIAVVIYEFCLMYYALGGRPDIVVRSTEAAFSYHRRSGLRLIYSLVLFLGAFEMVGLHLFLAARNSMAAWALTAFEFYGVVWIIGLLRSVDRLPIVLGESGIHIRFGVTYTLFVPYEAVQDLQRDRLHLVDTKRKNYLNCAFINAPDCILKLSTAMRARLPYTLSKEVDEIGLMVDEPRQFMAQLEKRIADSRNLKAEVT